MEEVSYNAIITVKRATADIQTVRAFNHVIDRMSCIFPPLPLIQADCCRGEGLLLGYLRVVCQ